MASENGSRRVGQVDRRILITFAEKCRERYYRRVKGLSLRRKTDERRAEACQSAEAAVHRGARRLFGLPLRREGDERRSKSENLSGWFRRKTDERRVNTSYPYSKSLDPRIRALERRKGAIGRRSISYAWAGLERRNEERRVRYDPILSKLARRNAVNRRRST